SRQRAHLTDADVLSREHRRVPEHLGLAAAESLEDPRDDRAIEAADLSIRRFRSDPSERTVFRRDPRAAVLVGRDVPLDPEPGERRNSARSSPASSRRSRWCLAALRWIENRSATSLTVTDAWLWVTNR